MNAIDIIRARQGNAVHEKIQERNAEGWRLLGPVTTCLLEGGYTHYILTWERT